LIVKKFGLLEKISILTCDGEDWSNDAGNTALHHRNKLYFKVYLKKKSNYFIQLFNPFFLIQMIYISFFHFTGAFLTAQR